MDSASSWSDWVKLNYVNTDNNRIKPVTISIPEAVMAETNKRLRGRGFQVIQYSSLRRKFDALTNRSKRSS